MPLPSIPITFPQVPVSTKPREKREELLKTETSRLDAFFAVPAVAVAMAIVCNMLWGAAFPFIKMGYRLFAIDAADTLSILCFAGVRFMLGAVLVWICGAALERKPLPMPRGRVLAECCALGLWQTTAQYFFYYSAVALLTGALGGILNSTQSFLGVILAHFLYGKADRMTPRKAVGCALGFGGGAGGYPGQPWQRQSGWNGLYAYGFLYLYGGWPLE